MSVKRLNVDLLFIIICYKSICGYGLGATLSFQDLGETGAPVLPLPHNNDISDGPISVSGIPYLTEMATDLYISDNGLISLNGEFVDPPQQGSDFSAADGEGVVIIAPYWSDNDIRLSGAVEYVQYTSTHQIPAVGAKLEQVSEFISNETGTVFSGVWMLLVEWNNCPPFPAGSSDSIDPSIDATFLSSNNSYQAIVITDSVSQSYVLFIYECDRINWSGRDSNHSRVGISDGMGTSYVYPTSGSTSIVDIDCLNSPRSTVVNILLDLNTFTLVEPVIPSVISSSITLPSSAFDSVSPSMITVMPTPSQMLPPVVSTVMMDVTQATSNDNISVTVAPAPTKVQNDTDGSMNTLQSVHVIIIPVVVALFLIIIGTLIIISVCIYMQFKAKVLKVTPAGEVKLVQLIL